MIVCIEDSNELLIVEESTFLMENPISEIVYADEEDYIKLYSVYNSGVTFPSIIVDLYDRSYREIYSTFKRTLLRATTIKQNFLIVTFIRDNLDLFNLNANHWSLENIQLTAAKLSNVLRTGNLEYASSLRGTYIYSSFIRTIYNVYNSYY